MEGLQKISRRGLLVSAAGAVLTIALAGPGGRALAQSGTGSIDNAFLSIDSDGRVLVTLSQNEIGQGSSTGLSMIVADELGAAWDQVSFTFATGKPEYWHPVIYFQEQITAGSLSIVAFEMPMRLAAASAQTMLLEAASNRLGASIETLDFRAGEVVQDGVATGVPMGALVAEAAKLDPPIEPSLRPVETRSIVGTPTPRLDVREKVTGRSVFGTDVVMDGMVFASVRQAPVFGQSLRVIDAGPALARNGVLAVVPVPRGFGVVATNWWTANQALDDVGVETEGEPQGLSNSAEISAKLDRALNEGDKMVVLTRGTLDGAIERQIEARYDVPFLAHTTMEPMNATARWSDDMHVELWIPTQAPTLDMMAVASATGIPVENVKVHMTYAGGGFGRRGFSEYSVQAALLARELGRPVKVIWSREEDIAQDYHRPAFAGNLRASIEGDRLTGIQADVAGPGIWAFNRPPVVEFYKGVDPLAVEGLNDMGYDIPNAEVRHTFVSPDRQIGYWRSIGYTHNTFFIESFLDEVFETLGQDPLVGRKALVAHDQRSIAVLDRVAEMSQWHNRQGRHLGLAFFQAERWQTRVAQVAEVRLDDDRITIERVYVAADVGQAVNPMSVETQLQGAVNFGLTAAAYGEITLEDGQIVETNFPDYPMLTLADAPQIDVTILQGGDRPGSVGEVGVPCAAPALVNAVFAATGKRIRSLPLKKHGLI